MNNYQIYPMATHITYPDASMLNMEMEKGTESISPFISWLICGCGKYILVDTGGCSPEIAEKNHHIRCIQTPRMYILNQLSKLGVSPDDISEIILTHLHWDHCYNLELFPKADIYVQKRELQYALSPRLKDALSYEAPASGLIQPWSSSRERFVLVDGDFCFSSGINLLLMPGHTPGTQNVLINTEKGKYLLSSDSVPTFGNIRFDGSLIPNRIFYDMDSYVESLDRTRKLQAEILPSHEPEMMKHLVFPE